MWTSALAAELWAELKPGARRILAEIARQPGGVPLGTLRARLDMETANLGGNLSSVGFAMNRLRKRHGAIPAAYPYATDYAAQTFSMPPALAACILALNEQGEGAYLA